jgi:hypothetical protein
LFQILDLYAQFPAKAGKKRETDVYTRNEMLNMIMTTAHELTIIDKEHTADEICEVVQKNFSVIEATEQNCELHEAERQVFLTNSIEHSFDSR